MAQNDIPSMDTSALYLEETFTDNAVGTIRRMTPVDADGKPDPSRPVQYIGQAQMMTPAGALPLSFEIEADSLGAACAQFGELAQKSMEETIKELQEMRRQQASQIVVPGQGGGMGGMGGGMGGMGGGGKIQMP